MDSEQINNLVNTIGNVVSNVGGATASVIGALNAQSGSVTSGGSTYVYGNSGNTSSFPNWLLPVLGGVLVLGLIIFKK